MLNVNKTSLLEVERNFTINKIYGGELETEEAREAVDSYINTYSEILNRRFPKESSFGVTSESLQDLLSDFYNEVDLNLVLNGLPETLVFPLEVIIDDVEYYINSMTILTEEEKKDLITNIITDLKALGKKEICAKEYLGVYISYTSKQPAILRSTAEITYEALESLLGKKQQVILF